MAHLDADRDPDLLLAISVDLGNGRPIVNCQSRLHWMIQRYPFETAHDGLATMYRVPGQQRYHGSKLDALDAAIYAESLKAVMPDRRATK